MPQPPSYLITCHDRGEDHDTAAPLPVPIEVEIYPDKQAADKAGNAMRQRFPDRSRYCIYRWAFDHKASPDRAATKPEGSWPFRGNQTGKMQESGDYAPPSSEAEPTDPWFPTFQPKTAG